jgi:hypothetical protein
MCHSSCFDTVVDVLQEENMGQSGESMVNCLHECKAAVGHYNFWSDGKHLCKFLQDPVKVPLLF